MIERWKGCEIIEGNGEDERQVDLKQKPKERLVQLHQLHTFAE